jgi:hypothetical protein
MFHQIVPSLHVVPNLIKNRVTAPAKRRPPSKKLISGNGETPATDQEQPEVQVFHSLSLSWDRCYDF